jgi:uncharacterized protein (TIGR02611 family)
LRKHAKRLGVFIVGWLVVVVGLALVPLPGPGWAIVFVGLSILATEFTWAERLKHWVQRTLANWVHRVQARRAARRRQRLGIADEVVDDVLADVESEARAGNAGRGNGNRSVAS